MKLSDYVAKFLESQGVKHVFVITGGAVAHLIDSLAKNPNISYICNQHEQASSMAAESYSRVTGNIGVAYATSGPGATNMITGICCAFFDSIPALYITGQVATFRLSNGSGVRQLGFQETDIVSVIKPVTKYATLLRDPSKIRYELEKSIHCAKTGRPGPVLIDIPDDLQRAEIDPDNLEGFTAEQKEVQYNQLDSQTDKVVEMIGDADRPIVIFGAGVNLSKSRDLAVEFARKLGFPVVLTWATKDLMDSDDPLVVGTFGLTGSRYGNFAVQNSDLVISIGSRLDTHHTGSPVDSFARQAKKIVVDIEQAELDKFDYWKLKIDLPIAACAGEFLRTINPKLDNVSKKSLNNWLAKIDDWKCKYPMCKEEYYNEEKLNRYVILNELSKVLIEDDIIVVDTGESLALSLNTINIKKGQQIFSAYNTTPMGYSLPAAIGASFAKDGKRIICISGDGGLQMNIQELATVVKHNLPIKIFVFNNQGYNMIKETQNQWLDSNYAASSLEGGVAIPDFVAIAKAYGMNANSIGLNSEIDEKLDEVFSTPGPFLCNLNIEPKPDFLTTKFGRPIEDIAPLLPRDEFESNMLIPIVDVSRNPNP